MNRIIELRLIDNAGEATGKVATLIIPEECIQEPIKAGNVIQVTAGNNVIMTGQTIADID